VGFAVDLQYVGPWCQVPDRDGHAGLEDSVPAFPAQEVKDAPGCLRFQLQEKLVLGWIRKNGGRVGMMVFVDAGRAFQGVVVELEHFLTAKDPIVIKDILDPAVKIERLNAGAATDMEQTVGKGVKDEGVVYLDFRIDQPAIPKQTHDILVILDTGAEYVMMPALEQTTGIADEIVGCPALACAVAVATLEPKRGKL
jgi:hypothetical protein